MLIDIRVLTALLNAPTARTFVRFYLLLSMQSIFLHSAWHHFDCIIAYKTRSRFNFDNSNEVSAVPIFRLVESIKKALTLVECESASDFASIQDKANALDDLFDLLIIAEYKGIQ